MSKLRIPESWAEAILGDIFTIVGGGTPSSSNKVYYADSGKGISWITPADLGKHDEKLIFQGAKDITQSGLDSCSAKLLPPGSVLFSSRAPIGHIAIAGKAVCTNQGFKSIAKSAHIESDFIYYQLKYLKEYIASLGSGTTFKEVSGAVMKTVKFSIPPSGEQRRIVAKIESTHAKVKTIESNISKAEELIEKFRESLLQKAFHGELVPQDPNDEPVSKLIERIRTERAKQSDGKKMKKDALPHIKIKEIPFEIPKSWEWVSLKFILEKLTDGTHHSPPNHDKGDFKYISAKNIKDWGIDLTKITYVSKSVHKEIYSRCDPKFGDVLLIKDGATTGIATINTLNEPFSMLSSVALLRPSIGINSNYLLWFLKSNEFQSQILGDMAGAAIKRVTLSKLENMLLPLPPLKEQERIISEINFKITRLKECKNALNSLTECTKSLIQSILSSAFSGQLVLQVPSEGTGHELLEKIKFENPPAAEIKVAKQVSTPAKRKRAKNE